MENFNSMFKIGSTLFLAYPLMFHAEAYYPLKKTLGVQSHLLHTFETTCSEYRNSNVILGIDIEQSYTQELQDGTHGRGIASRIADHMHLVVHADHNLKTKFTSASAAAHSVNK